MTKLPKTKRKCHSLRRVYLYSGRLLTLALIAAKRQARRAARRLRRPRKPIKKVLGSSWTWGERELKTLGVKVQMDVDVHRMIPHQFFDFTKLERYERCI